MQTLEQKREYNRNCNRRIAQENPDFFPAKNREYYIRHKEQCNANNARYRAEHLDHLQEWDRSYSRKRYQGERETVFAHYGGKCSCLGCEESNPMFLTIDHINNDGAERRRNGERSYADIIKAGYPEDLQILCANCNLGKLRNGGVCPHKKGN